MTLAPHRPRRVKLAPTEAPPSNFKLTELLDVIHRRRGECLELAAGRAPMLIMRRRPVEMDLPPVSEEQLRTLATRLLVDAQTDAERACGVFTARDRGRFTWYVRGAGEHLRIAFVPVPANAEPEFGAWPGRSITMLLEDAYRQRMADIVVSSGAEVIVRQAGHYEPIANAIFHDDDILEVLGDALTDERRATLKEKGSLDASLELWLPDQMRRARFRVNVFKQFNGLAAAFRPIWDQVPSIETLHLPPQLEALTAIPYGLVLVTGPTGSGKSTTLAALLQQIIAKRPCHVVTLEDPIEYMFDGGNGLVHQREVGTHVESFASGVRDALREAPDVILVGEMRDRDTIQAAISAAETGHLVLSTLHTGTAAQAIDRIIDVFPEGQHSQIRIQLADVLEAVVTQRLLPAREGAGRFPAVEIVRINHAFSTMIREKKTHQFAGRIQMARGEGALPFDRSLADLVKGGQISTETAVSTARDPRYLESLLAG